MKKKSFIKKIAVSLGNALVSYGGGSVSLINDRLLGIVSVEEMTVPKEQEFVIRENAGVVLSNPAFIHATSYLRIEQSVKFLHKSTEGEIEMQRGVLLGIELVTSALRKLATGKQ